jgi:hypothetical protein
VLGELGGQTERPAIAGAPCRLREQVGHAGVGLVGAERVVSAQVGVGGPSGQPGVAHGRERLIRP